MLRKRYCQRCSLETQLDLNEQPKMCRGCGGTNYDDRPKPHVGVIRGYWLTEDDKIFLRVQRILPED